MSTAAADVRGFGLDAGPTVVRPDSSAALTPHPGAMRPGRRERAVGVGCRWFDPLVVEVVLGALVVGGRVLLGHRSPDKHAHPNAWDLPGGVIEVGESELDALAREMQEELGVQIAMDSVLHLCRVTAGPPSAPALLSAWLVRNWQGTPANLAPEEHVNIGWFGTEQLPPLAHVLVREAVVNALQGNAAEFVASSPAQTDVRPRSGRWTGR